MIKKLNRLRLVGNPSLRALLVGDALIMTSVAMLAPIYAFFVSEIGGDIFGAGITAAALAFGSGVMSLVAGRYLDSISNKRLVLMIGYAGMAVGFLLYTQINTVLQLALLQLVIGLGRPFYQTAFDALYSTHLDLNKEASEWGAWEATAHFTTGIGAIVGSLMVARWGFDGLFIFMSALCAIGTLHIARLPKRLLG